MLEFGLKTTPPILPGREESSSYHALRKLGHASAHATGGCWRGQEEERPGLVGFECETALASTVAVSLVD